MSDMSDKKRSALSSPTEYDRRKSVIADDQEPSEPTQKKRKVSLPPEILEGKLTPLALRRFKKEALLRALSSYRHTSEIFESQARQANKRLDMLQKVFSIQESLLENFVDQIDVALANNKHIQIPSSNVRTNFLLAIVGHEDVDDDTKVPIREGDLIAKYKSKTRELREKIDKLLEWDGVVNESNDLRTETSTTVNKYYTFESDYNVLKSNTLSLEKRLEEMTDKYLAAQRAISKLESPVTSALFGNGQKHEVEEVPPVEEPKSPVNGSSTEKEEAVDSEELEKLKLELEQTKAVVSKQHEQLRDQDNKIVSLNDIIRQTNNRLLHLSDSDLQHSHVYRSLRRKVDDLHYDLERLDKVAIGYSRDKSALIAERAAFQDKIKRDYDSRMDDLQARLNKAENDVSRIRAARDELLSSLNIKRASETERTKSFEELKELVELRETRIKSLEKDIQRLKDEVSASDRNDTDDEKIDSCTSLEELKSIAKKLKREKASLEAELPDLEAAFNSAHQKATAKVMDTLDREAKMNKLSVEKTKADEKYFSAMRAKDALNAEYQKVRGQLARNAEWIQQLKETERKNQHQIGVLEKDLNDLKGRLNSEQRERDNVSSKLSDSERRGDSLRALTQKMEGELSSMDKKIRAEVELRRETEQEIERLKKQLEIQSIGLKGKGGLANGGGQDSSDLDMQVQELRTIAICSVCSKNWKDTAIKVCGHVFCESCAVDRLTARLRKCPLCNKQYSHSDLLPIHL